MPPVPTPFGFQQTSRTLVLDLVLVRDPDQSYGVAGKLGGSCSFTVANGGLWVKCDVKNMNNNKLTDHT